MLLRILFRLGAGKPRGLGRVQEFVIGEVEWWHAWKFIQPKNASPSSSHAR
jgi:hypothetical protein